VNFTEPLPFPQPPSIGLRVCPLCREVSAELFLQDVVRCYFRCGNCALVHVPAEYFLSRAGERAQYDQHENDPGDPRYRRFLSRLCRPMLSRLGPHSSGLDFGSGPGPTLSVMLAEAGHLVRLFDPFYALDTAVFDEQYDFITASEVVEHLHDPAFELQRLWDCLKPGGLLGVMTSLLDGQSSFADWHYIRDPTHVCFYSAFTWQWLAEQWRTRAEIIDNKVILLQRVQE
jgi:Methyltransferase domain